MQIGISVDVEQISQSYELVKCNLDILRHVQFYLNDTPLNLQKEEILKFQKYFKTENFTYSLHSYGYINLCETIDMVRKSWVDFACDTIKLAKETTSSFVNYHMGYTFSKDNSRKLLLQNLCNSLKEISEFAQEYFININIENDFNTLEIERLGSRLSDFDTVLKCNYPNLKICYDVGHANIAFSTPFEYKMYISNIQSFHIHNNFGKSDLHNAFGENGSIDLELVLTELLHYKNIYFILENNIEMYNNAFKHLRFILNTLQEPL